jgi:uncharacterized iron-regulated protein
MCLTLDDRFVLFEQRAGDAHARGKMTNSLISPGLNVVLIHGFADRVGRWMERPGAKAMPRLIMLSALILAPAVICAGVPESASPAPQRCEIWIDLYSGEPVPYEDVFEDLLGASVIYLGERHTLDRHHNLQEKIIAGLAGQGVKVAVGLEMHPVDVQPALDKYNSGEITFDEFAQEVGWGEIWDNYEQYRPAIEAAHAVGAPILALNARRELAKQVAGSGLEGLDPEWAERIPVCVDADQPEYERELMRVMMVMAHATGQSDMMRRMFEAQVIKDEVMADAIARFMLSPEGDGHTVVVLCGAGHVSYGYGIPSRVRSRIPGVVDRILVFSESGDVVLSEREKAMARMIEITHEQLRENTVPFADYLHAKALAPQHSGEAEAPEVE